MRQEVSAGAACGADQVEADGGEIVEQSLAGPDDGQGDDEPQLVDETGREQRAGDGHAAVDADVAAWS